MFPSPPNARKLRELEAAHARIRDSEARLIPQAAPGPRPADKSDPPGTRTLRPVSSTREDQRPTRRPWAVYARVSTKREDQEGGLASQLEACLEFLRGKGLPSQNVIAFREQASGRQTNRPVLRKLLQQAAMHRFEGVVVFKLDRLSRGGIVATFSLLRAFHDHGVRVLSTAEPWWDAASPVHEVILAVLAFAAQIESQSISERVSAGIARKRAEAQRRGELFYWGRARTSALRKDPELPAKATQMRKEGRSWSETARAMRVSRTTARRLYLLGQASKVTGTADEEEQSEEGLRAT